MSYKLLKTELFTEIKPFVTTHKKENIIVALAKLITDSELLVLTKTATKKQEEGTSFIVINSTINIDELSEELNVVPTLQEAIDVLDMEEMMRDLA